VFLRAFNIPLFIKVRNVVNVCVCVSPSFLSVSLQLAQAVGSCITNVWYGNVANVTTQSCVVCSVMFEKKNIR
jgi:hypothetical protein